MNHPLKQEPAKPEPRKQEHWRTDGVCATVDPALHFPEGTKKTRTTLTAIAVKICHSCPVLEQCRTYAITTKQKHGIWGGLSEDQLSVMARRPNG